MTKAVFRKNGHALYALCDASRDLLSALKDGKDVMVEVRAARNPAHHRKFFVMLQKVIDAGCWEYDLDALLDWVKFRVGHVNKVVVNGKLYVTPKSIAFESMDQASFQKFYERAVYYLCAEIAGPELAAELAQIADGPYQDQRAA